MAEGVQRRLAAILAADVAGYSRLIGRDEEGTLSRLRVLRREIIDPKIDDYRGRIVKTTGDGLLVEFASVVEAFRCALAIQYGLAERNIDVPTERRIDLRIGINVGDIVVEDGDIYGDGVNVAARLEGLADPGGIYVSTRVHEDVRGKVEVIFEDLGEQKLKNIAFPVRVYRAQLNGNAAALKSFSSGDHSPLADSEKFGPPVVAVLPMNDLSGDVRWERLADGLSADIIADLARYPDLAVVSHQTMLSYKGKCEDVRSIGRALNADYLLESSLQSRQGQVRISVQLVDGASGADLWAARYDQSAEDLFVFQDKVTENVVNVLASECGKLLKLRRDVLRRKHPASLRAYDCYLLGQEQNGLLSRESNVEAIRLLSRAVELDPGLARAWTNLGLAHSVQACNGFADDPDVPMRAWRACIEQALVHDPDDLWARTCMACFLAMDGEFEAAGDEHNRVLAAAPNNSDVLAFLAGNVALVVGDALDGCELARRAIQLNPHVPWYYGMLGRCCFVAGLFKECLAALKRSSPQMPSNWMFQVLAHTMLDQPSEAKRIAARLHEDFPKFSAELFIKTYPVTNPQAIAAIREGAHRAGL